jgi:hypothetical protein
MPRVTFPVGDLFKILECFGEFLIAERDGSPPKCKSGASEASFASHAMAKQPIVLGFVLELALRK